MDIVSILSLFTAFSSRLQLCQVQHCRLFLFFFSYFIFIFISFYTLVSEWNSVPKIHLHCQALLTRNILAALFEMTVSSFPLPDMSGEKKKEKKNIVCLSVSQQSPAKLDFIFHRCTSKRILLLLGRHPKLFWPFLSRKNNLHETLSMPRLYTSIVITHIYIGHFFSVVH